jgi:hypothetical protein
MQLAEIGIALTGGVTFGDALLGASNTVGAQATIEPPDPEFSRIEISVDPLLEPRCESDPSSGRTAGELRGL